MAGVALDTVGADVELGLLTVAAGVDAAEVVVTAPEATEPPCSDCDLPQFLHFPGRNACTSNVHDGVDDVGFALVTGLAAVVFAVVVVVVDVTDAGLLNRLTGNVDGAPVVVAVVVVVLFVIPPCSLFCWPHSRHTFALKACAMKFEHTMITVAEMQRCRDGLRGARGDRERM